MNDYSQTHRTHEAEGWPEWSAAASIDEMAELVIDWLHGRTPVLPWHFGPPDEETAAIQPQLVTLNRLGGVLSTSSQPGLEADGWRQRAWVTGFATSAKLEVLIRQAEEGGLVVQTATRIGPNDPVISDSVNGDRELVTFARATPLGKLTLPDPARDLLKSCSLPFSIHDPLWGTNRMWRQLLAD